MAELAFRTSICSVVFVDIVDYSKEAVDRQVTMKSTLNDAIRKGLLSAMEDELIVLDSGDGAAICFFGDPEDALFSATAITGELRSKLRLRTGINLGPVKVVTDLNGNRNVIGDAINVAQRIMSFAGEGEVLISRPYFEVVSCLRDENTFRFQSLGTRKDKHIREHEVYSVASASEQALRIEGPVQNDEPPQMIVATESVISSEFIETCRYALAGSIGPLAGMIVKRTAQETSSREALVTALASKIESHVERQTFLRAVGNGAAASTSDAPMPADRNAHIEIPEPDPSDDGITDDLVAQAGDLLAQAIGPIAKPLTRRAAAQASDTGGFLSMLAGHIDDTASRQRFLEAMKV